MTGKEPLHGVGGTGEHMLLVESVILRQLVIEQMCSCYVVLTKPQALQALRVTVAANSHVWAYGISCGHLNVMLATS